MANRYWVGGTGSWNGTNTTNWSATSGGAGGASVPTTADDVFINASSGAGTVTIASGNTGAKSITFTGFTGILVGFDPITVAGSVTFSSGLLVSYTGTITITGTGTLTSAGQNFGNIIINGVGITVTLGDAFNNYPYDFTINLGNFTTNNYAFSCANFQSATSNSRVITLGSSTLTIQGWSVNPSGLTLNAGTSSIVMPYNSSNFDGGGLTYYNLSSTVSSVYDYVNIQSANTFNQLSITSPSAAGLKSVFFNANQTITTMVCSGATAVRRILLASNVVQTQRTLTITTWTTISDVDFRDIGLNTSRSGTRLGNCGGNTNITFPAAKTVYWNLAGAQNWSATGWATSSGGAPAVNNFPLAQDTAVFDNTGSVTGTITINQDFNLPAINMSARTSAMTLAQTSSISGNYIYGSWTNGSGTTLSFNGWLDFAGTGTQVLTTAGKTFTGLTVLYIERGTLQFADAITSTASLRFGGTVTVDFNSNTISFGSVNITAFPTLAFGASGILNVTGSGATVFNSGAITTSGSKTVRITYSGSVATTVRCISILEANALDFYFTAGTYTGGMAQSSRARNLDYTGFAGTQSNIVLTILGNLTASTGMTFAGGTNALSFGATSGTKTIETKGKTLDFPINFNGVGGTFTLLDNLTSATTRTVSLINGTLDLNGFTFITGLFAIAAGTKNLTFNGGTLNVIDSGATAFNNAQPTNFTTTAGTGTGKIQMSSATAKTFVGGGSTFNCTLDQAGAGALTISGTNTFNDISNSRNTVGASTITFAGNQTVVNFTATGVSGRILTINSSVAGTQRTLTKSGGGIVSVDYMSIRDSNATGGSWYAGANSTNVSNNLGWIFTAPPVGGASNNFLLMFM